MNYKRNQKIVDLADELVAFHIKTKDSDGLGTMDTVERAREKDIVVKLHSYDLDIDIEN
jgi:hypothetical protein